MMLDWSDVQSLVVRGTNMPFSWHVFYAFPTEGAGKELLRWIRPRVNSGAPISEDAKPDLFTFVGLTYRGLQTLGLEKLLKKHDAALTLGDHAHFSNPFPSEFIDEPERSSLGDTHPHDEPATWWNGRFSTNRIHGSLHVYCRTEAAGRQSLGEFRAKLATLGIEELNPKGPDADPLFGKALDDPRRVHFGYVDGVVQPDVDWDSDEPTAGRVDRRHFLLGYGDGAPSAPGYRRTGEMFRNSTYVAFRWLSQDVPAFEKFLTDRAPLLKDVYPQATDLRELLAAKLVGRWRSGVSLLDAPVNDNPALAPNGNFRFAPTDSDGLRCPFSSHIRVTNPRDQELDGIVAEVPRLIRRGMVYGPAWRPGENDLEDRGLFGMFVCASLERQFQMIMRWMNRNDFSPKFPALVPQGQDSLFGARGSAASRPPFRIPLPEGRLLEIPMPDQSFIRSRGTAYLLFPGLKTLQMLSDA